MGVKVDEPALTLFCGEDSIETTYVTMHKAPFVAAFRVSLIIGRNSVLDGITRTRIGTRNSLVPNEPGSDVAVEQTSR